MKLLETDDEDTIRHAAIEKARFVADRVSSPPLAIAEQLVTIAHRKPQVLPALLRFLAKFIIDRH